MKPPTSLHAGEASPADEPAERPSGHSLRRRLISGGVWVIAGRAVGILSTVITSAILARVLSPHDFGDFGLIVSVAGATALVGMFGLNSAVIRFAAERLAQHDVWGARHVLRLSFGIAGCATTLVAFFASAGFYLFGGNWLTVERPLSVAALVAAATAALALYNLTAASLRGVREMRVSSFLGGQQQGGPLGNLLFLVFAAAVWLLHGLSLATTLAAYTAAYTLALGLGIAALRKVVQRIYVPNTSSGPPALLSAARLLSTCVPMLVAQLLSFASRQADLWIAGATVSPEELALYVGATRAVQLVAVPLSLVNLSVMSLIPELRSQKRLAELERMLQTSATLAALPATAALGLFIVLPGLMLSIFLGPYYRGAAIPLVCLSVGQFVFTWTGAKELALLLSGHEKVVAAINALAAAALLGAGYIVCLQNGIVGLAIVAAVVISLQNLVQWVLAKKLVGVWTHATLYL